MRNLILAAVMFTATTAWAVRFYNTSGAITGTAANITCSTGLTCSMSGNKMVMSSSPTVAGSLTLASDEVISNAVDDIVDISSNDENTTLQVSGFEAKSAILNLYADQGDDAADKWSFTVNTSGVLTVAQAGAAADMKLAAFEATDSSITLQADESDDNGDDWKVSAAASGNALAISNDTTGSHVAKLTLSTAGAMTSVVSITGAGTGSLSGYLRAQVASTTASLTAAQCGSTIISDSADVMTLPEASTVLGCRYSVVCGTADDLDINPADGTDQILPVNSVAAGTGAAIAPAAGDAIRCTDAGSSITIEAIGANAWAAVGVANGAWTDVN